MGLKETLDNARIGQSAQNAKAIETGSEVMADKHLQREEMRMAREQAMVEERMQRDNAVAEKGFRAGQAETRRNVMQMGVMPVETAEAAIVGAEAEGEAMGQEQGYTTGSEEQAMADRDQMRQEDSMGAAQQIVSQIDEAQAQGATPEQIQQMVSQIPDELRGSIDQIQQERAMQQAQEQGQPMAPTQVPGAPAQAGSGMSAQQNPSVANQMSDKVMQDIAQMELQKQQAMEQAAMQQAQAQQQQK